MHTLLTLKNDFQGVPGEGLHTKSLFLTIRARDVFRQSSRGYFGLLQQIRAFFFVNLPLGPLGLFLAKMAKFTLFHHVSVSFFVFNTLLMPFLRCFTSVSCFKMILDALLLQSNQAKAEQ